MTARMGARSWMYVQLLAKYAHPEDVKSEIMINYDNNACQNNYDTQPLGRERWHRRR